MPTLVELHQKLFGKDFGDAHDASYDVAATARCFFGLMHAGVIKPIDATLVADMYTGPNLEAANFTKREKKNRQAIPLPQPIRFQLISHLFICTFTRSFLSCKPQQILRRL